jgi:cell division protein FtsB
MSATVIGMRVGSGHRLKRALRALVLPTVLLLLTTYAVWNAVHGSRGLHSFAERQQELKLAQADLARAQADLAAWQQRVDALRDHGLDLDALDERARAMLNYSDPTDIVVMYGKGKHLY